MDQLVIDLIDAATDIAIHWPDSLSHKRGPDRCECSDCERRAALERAVRALDPEAI